MTVKGQERTEVVLSPQITLGDGFRYVQTMASRPYSDYNGLTSEVAAAAATNCSLFRLSARTVKDVEAAEILRVRFERDDFLFVLDTHFNVTVTLEAIKRGFRKVRINPGNMDVTALVDVVNVSRDCNCAVRIGLNGGSCREKLGVDYTAEDVLGLFGEYIHAFEKEGHRRLVLSAKFSDFRKGLEVNRLLAAAFPYPIHLGVTEAGSLVSSTVKHTLFLAPLLSEGIGDTVRVSITGDCVSEINTANEILRETGVYRGIGIISCPTCGRTFGDLAGLEQDLRKGVTELEYTLFRPQNRHGDGASGWKGITVALMGCEVNGPGEAADAEIGASLTENGAVIFEHGERKQTVKRDEIVPAIISHLKERIRVLDKTV